MSKNTSEDGWHAFIKLCCTFRNPKDLDAMFDLFFTIEEKEALSKRYHLVQALLEERLTQREIAEKLGVSISKITRGSNALKIVSNKLKEALRTKMAS